MGSMKVEGNAANVEGFEHCLDGIFSKVNKLEKRANENERFYKTANDTQLNTPKSSSVVKDKVKEKHLSCIEKQQEDAFHREAAAEKRMQELMHQLEKIL